MQSVVVVCCPVEAVVELPVRKYPTVVYIPENPIQQIVQESQARGNVRRVLGIALPIAQRQ